jgi:putative ABC transport system ATP-binding protein
MTYCIDIENLAFNYDRQTQFAIQKLQIEPGKHCFLEGPSGCGKSTFLGLLSGILRPTAGRLHVLGEDLRKLPASKLDRFRAQKIGYIFQRFNLVPHLTVKENIELSGFFAGADARKKPKKSVDELADSLEISGILYKAANTISVGQAQRVAAARAFAQSPELLLADEPTSSLDQPLQQAFMKALLAVAKENKTTVVFVSHNPELAKYFDTSLGLADFMKMQKQAGQV